MTEKRWMGQENLNAIRKQKRQNKRTVSSEHENKSTISKNLKRRKLENTREEI
jgi:hypothetical protein